MAAKLVLQIGEVAVNCISGVGNAQFRMVVPSEQPRQIADQTQVCASQSTVGVA